MRNQMLDCGRYIGETIFHIRPRWAVAWTKYGLLFFFFSERRNNRSLPSPHLGQEDQRHQGDLSDPLDPLDRLHLWGQPIQAHPGNNSTQRSDIQSLAWKSDWWTSEHHVCRSMMFIIMSLFFIDYVEKGLTIENLLSWKKETMRSLFSALLCWYFGKDIWNWNHSSLVHFKFVGTPLPPTGDLDGKAVTYRHLGHFHLSFKCATYLVVQIQFKTKFQYQ